ncbi:unnamed protein product [Clavelina lepadiformis]|uniref:Uncharacterized protein n=1 Tax=Clavelina lepadiformis TaxID=159417 RepID=A0ABP0F5J0_CLALP
MNLKKRNIVATENDLTQRIVKRILKIGNGTLLPLKLPCAPLCGQNAPALPRSNSKKEDIWKKPSYFPKILLFPPA